MKLDTTFIHDRNNPVWIMVFDNDTWQKRILLTVFSTGQCHYVDTVSEEDYANFKPYSLRLSDKWREIKQPHPLDKWKVTGWVKSVNNPYSEFWIERYFNNVNQVVISGEPLTLEELEGKYTPCKSPITGDKK